MFEEIMYCSEIEIKNTTETSFPDISLVINLDNNYFISLKIKSKQNIINY